MTLFDFMDEWFDTEPWKCTVASAAWWSGAAAHWEGVAIPAFINVMQLFIAALSIPRGGMHGYFHAIFRAAIANGTTFKAACPVEEIIIQNGRAVGVRLRDDAATREKTIWADKAVISACDIKQTFNKLVGPRHLDKGFLQKINDISVKGGTLWVSQFLLKKPLSWKPKWQKTGSGHQDVPYGSAYPWTHAISTTRTSAMSMPSRATQRAGGTLPMVPHPKPIIRPDRPAMHWKLC